MQEYIDKARHTQDLHDFISEKVPGKYSDWKITLLFYVAIHLLKAFAAKRGVDIGNTHERINSNLNPGSKNKVIEIERGMWDEYFSLYQYSRNARYDGIENKDAFDSIMKNEYSEAIKALTRFKLYLKPEGVQC